MKIKSKIYLKCVLILILFLMCLTIFLNRENNTCNNCMIKFDSIFMEVENSFSVRAFDIYHDFMNVKCSVTKTPQGYMKNG